MKNLKTIGCNFTESKQGLIKEIFRAIVFGKDVSKTSEKGEDEEENTFLKEKTEENDDFLRISKQTLMNKEIDLTIAMLLETLTKTPATSYYPISLEDINSSIKNIILGFLDESTLEKCSEELEQIQSYSPPELLSLVLLLKPLSTLKYSFRAQSEALISIFAESTQEKMDQEGKPSSSYDRSLTSLKSIKCPEEFLLNCLLMLTYTNSYVFSKFIQFEKEINDEHPQISTLRSLLSEETFMKLNVIKNGQFHPLPLNHSNLMQLCEHYNLEKLTDIASVSSYIQLLRNAIDKNFEDIVSKFLESFRIFEYKEEFFDDHDIYDKAIFVPTG